MAFLIRILNQSNHRKTRILILYTYQDSVRYRKSAKNYNFFSFSVHKFFKSVSVFSPVLVLFSCVSYVWLFILIYSFWSVVRFHIYYLFIEFLFKFFHDGHLHNLFIILYTWWYRFFKYKIDIGLYLIFVETFYICNDCRFFFKLSFLIHKKWLHVRCWMTLFPFFFYFYTFFLNCICVLLKFVWCESLCHFWQILSKALTVASEI